MPGLEGLPEVAGGGPGLLTDGLVGRAATPDGGELTLHARAGVYHIRRDGLELMSSRAHGSEAALARLACAGLSRRTAPAVLVGGLGMGYTLRAALDALPADATVVVAELFGAVVEWNRGPLASLAGRPLDDPRVTVEVADVATILATADGRFDAILLDVDNGPGTLTLEANRRLYEGPGLAEASRALAPGGILAVWSPEPAPVLERRLREIGFDVSAEAVAARGAAGDPRHTVIVARWPGPAHARGGDGGRT